MTIPALDGVGKPVFEGLHSIDILSLYRSSDENALHRFGHIEPGASARRVQESNAAFMTPTHPIVTVMACQIIQNEQHAQRRVHPIQLRGCGKWVPILPASPFWNQFWSGWTLLEDSCQLTFEPGVQNRIRTLLDWFSAQIPVAGRNNVSSLQVLPRIY